MRRYAIRFAVAVLTFGLGIGLSLILGLFKPQQVKSGFVYIRRSSCSRQLRPVRAPFVTVDSEVGDPLKLVYLGETSDGKMDFVVTNQRQQAISGYSLSSESIWRSQSRDGNNASFAFTSNEVLDAGESRSIQIPRGADGLTIRVSTVTFQSGFTWMNSRELVRDIR